MKKLLLAAIVLSPVFFPGCRENDTEEPTKAKLNVLVDPRYNGVPLAFNTGLTYGSGQNIQFSMLKFYAGNFYFEKADGTRQSLTDKYLLFEQGSYQQLLAEIDPGSFTKTGWGFGIASNRNTQNGADAQVATDYPANDPLNPAADMYWGWAQGYIFSKLEGRLDVDGNGSFTDSGDKLISYHPGTDYLYQEVEFPLSFAPEPGKEYTLTVTIDVNTLISACDFEGKPAAHPTSNTGADYAAARNLIQQWGNAITVSVQ